MSSSKLPLDTEQSLPDLHGVSLALVQDALPAMGGAERLLAACLELFPAAPLYALVYNPELFRGTIFADRQVYTSFMNRVPGVRRHYRSFLPVLPLAVKSFDLQAYDLVFSFSYAVAHGVRIHPGQLHLNYTYTPLRQAWQAYPEFIASLSPGPPRLLAGLVLQMLRRWDRAAAQRVGDFAAPSFWMAGQIRRVYGREAEVIYPPVEVERFTPAAHREEFYLVVTRLEPHKRVDRILEAFARLQRPLLVVGTGSQFERLSVQAATNIHMLGWQSDQAVSDLLGRARAYVQMAEEDFGIAAVEAQAAGCPVIAYRGGGAAETVIDGSTGLLFPQPEAGCLVQAVEAFERQEQVFETRRLIENAARFRREIFQERLAAFVARRWARFKETACSLN